MATRSKRLFNVLFPTVPPTSLYTVPAGFSTIVKTITFWNADSSARVFIVDGVVAGGGGTPYIWHYDTAVPANEVVQLELWHVLEAGDTISIGTDSPTWAAYGSGAELID